MEALTIFALLLLLAVQTVSHLRTRAKLSEVSAKLARLTDRDERGRFVKREGV